MNNYAQNWIRLGSLALGCLDMQAVTTFKRIWVFARDNAECSLKVVIGQGGDCWKQVLEQVTDFASTVVGIFVGDICPDADFGCCFADPVTWAVMHDVWVWLGLAPSSMMTFSHDIITKVANASLDGWVATTYDDTKHQLAAVNGLIRAQMKQDASRTFMAVHKQNPDNLLYQYLMYKYVNNNMGVGSPEQLRAKLIQDPYPEDLYKIDPSTKMKTFLGNGTYWNWEHDDGDMQPNNSMGWDLILIGNLVNREFAFDLDYYKTNVLPGLMNERKQAVRDAMATLEKSYAPIVQLENDTSLFIDQASGLLIDDKVQYAELQALLQQGNDRYARASSVSDIPVTSDLSASQTAYNYLVLLEGEARAHFQDAYRLDEFNQLWSDVVHEFAFVAPRIDVIEKDLARDSVSSRLSSLLSAVPLRIDELQRQGIETDIKDVSQQIVDAMKDISRQREYTWLKASAASKALSIAEPLRVARRSSLYYRASVLADTVLGHFDKAYAALLTSIQLLTDGDVQTIKADAVQVIQTEIDDWRALEQMLTVQEIVQGHLRRTNKQAAAIYQKLQNLPDDIQRRDTEQWLVRLDQAGYPVPVGCWASIITGGTDLSCWQFQEPSSSNDQDWELFDVLLNQLDVVVADFMTIVHGRQVRTFQPRQTAPSRGLIFDVNDENKFHCVQQPTGEGLRYEACINIPSSATFQADPLSSSGGNATIEGFTYHVHLELHALGGVSGQPEVPAVDWTCNKTQGSLAIGPDPLIIDVPVSYSGASVNLILKNYFASSAFFSGTRVEVVANYIYPDVNSFRAYARVLTKFGRQLGNIQALAVPGGDRAKLIDSIAGAIDVYTDVINDADTAPDTLANAKIARKNLEDSQQSITLACPITGANVKICDASVAACLTTINGLLDGVSQELESLRGFLDAEVLRLEQLDASTTAELKDILKGLKSVSFSRRARYSGITTPGFLTSRPRDIIVDMGAGRWARFDESDDHKFRAASCRQGDGVGRVTGCQAGDPEKEVISWDLGEPAAQGAATYLGILPGPNRTSGPAFTNTGTTEKGVVTFQMSGLLMLPPLLADYKARGKIMHLHADFIFNAIGSPAFGNVYFATRYYENKLWSDESVCSDEDARYTAAPNNTDWAQHNRTIDFELDLRNQQVLQSPWPRGFPDGCSLYIYAMVEAVSVQFVSLQCILLNPG